MDFARERRARTRAAIWRSAFALHDAADLCAQVRWVTEAAARAECRGVTLDVELAALRVAVREVERQVQRIVEVLCGG